MTYLLTSFRNLWPFTKFKTFLKIYDLFWSDSSFLKLFMKELTLFWNNCWHFSKLLTFFKEFPLFSKLLTFFIIADPFRNFDLFQNYWFFVWNCRPFSKNFNFFKIVGLYFRKNIWSCFNSFQISLLIRESEESFY